MCDCCDPTSPSPDPVVVRLEMEVERHLRECEARGARIAELDVDVARLRGLLREASGGILNEIDAVLYFGFMICESADGRAEVRIKFADLRHAQRLHSALVAIRNGAALEGKP